MGQFSKLQQVLVTQGNTLSKAIMAQNKSTTEMLKQLYEKDTKPTARAGTKRDPDMDTPQATAPAVARSTQPPVAGGDDKCFNCYGFGHIRSNCPNPPRLRGQAAKEYLTNNPHLVAATKQSNQPRAQQTNVAQGGSNQNNRNNNQNNNKQKQEPKEKKVFPPCDECGNLGHKTSACEMTKKREKAEKEADWASRAIVLEYIMKQKAEKLQSEKN
jgi:hypothetical protein